MLFKDAAGMWFEEYRNEHELKTINYNGGI